MMANTTPDVVVDKCSFTTDGSIYWASVDKIGLNFVWRGYIYENEGVMGAIEDFGGCLVELNYPGADKHWVLFIGDKKMIDPLTGEIESTSKYSDYCGYCIVENIQEEEVDNELVTVKKELEELKLKYAALEAVIPEKNAAISQLTESLASCQTQAESANANLTAIQEEKETISKSLASAEKKITKLEGELEEAIKEKNANWQLYKKALEGQTEKQDIGTLLKALFTKIFSK
jgi:hypothetical protein